MKQKIKTLGIILLTYFQVHAVAVVANMVALILWFIATVMTFTQPERFSQPVSSQWMIFLIALLNIMFVAVFNLRRIVTTNTGALFPYYRPIQLAGFGILLFVFVVWPLGIMYLKGLLLLPSLAYFLFIVNLFLWGVFNFGERAIITVSMLWLGKVMYDLLGFPSRFILVPNLFGITISGSAVLFQLLVIGGSLVLLILWGRYFLTIPGHKLPTRKQDLAGPYLTNYDRVNPWLEKLNLRSQSQLLKKNHSASFSAITRLIQPAIFSPNMAFVSHGLLMMIAISLVAGMGLYLYFNILRDGVVDIARILPLYSFAYVLIAGFVSLDFLQHRHRIPSLWLMTPFASRKKFNRALFLVYLKVALKNHLQTTLVLLALPLLFPSISFSGIFPTIVLGLAIFIFYIALSILIGHEVSSSDCKGWLLGAIMGFGYVWMITVIVSKTTFSNTLPTWYFIGAVLLVSLVMLWRSYYRWQETEFNYNGPEICSIEIQ